MLERILKLFQQFWSCDQNLNFPSTIAPSGGEVGGN